MGAGEEAWTAAPTRSSMAFMKTPIAFTLLAGLFLTANVSAQSWRPIGPEGGRVTACLIDEEASDTLYVGADFGGLFKSSDGGATWQALPNPEAIYFKHLAQAGERLYLSVNSGLYASDDDGASWQELSTALSSPMLDGLVIDPRDPSTLYGLANTYCNPGGVVIKSTDGGANWNELCVGQSTATVDALAVDPETPARLYAGTGCCGGGLFASSDGGANWALADTGLPSGQIHDIFVE